MDKYCPGAPVTHNVIYGPGLNLAAYPALNYWAASAAEIGWQNAASGDVRLRADSFYKGKGAGGRDPGVDYAAMAAATARALSGR